jgi:hypothetical protein
MFTDKNIEEKFKGNWKFLFWSINMLGVLLYFTKSVIKRSKAEDLDMSFS